MTQQVPAMLEYAKTPAGIRYIAQAQRRILVCILVEMVLYGLAIALQSKAPLASFGLVLAMFAVNIVATVFIFQLATKLYGVGVGIVLGILTLLPCVGLITLLIVNGKATTLLRKQGLKVGLLGAKVPDHM